MRNPQGYATIIDPTASRMTEERDVFRCAHAGTPGCLGIVHVKPMTDPVANGGLCLKCDDGKGLGRGLICKNCAGKPCMPYEKRTDIEEAAERKRLSAMVL